ncbi:MAG: response regulator [Thermodesulfobacteriota bacterium]
MAYKAKVLIVDDDPDTVELLTKRLSAEGYRTLGAYDGMQAIQQADKYGPDVIILDIKMPKMDGYEVCRRLKSSEDTRPIPVIMLTVKAKVPDKVKGLDIGADDYIPKPFDFREISRRVRYWSTLKKRVEERVGEIKRLEQELIKTERLAAIGQTVGGIAHYMKNVLFGLKGGVYLVNIASKEQQSDSTGWEMVERNMGRMSDLVLDLLEYSKDTELEYENCVPNDIAAKVCEDLKEKAEEHQIVMIKDFDPLLQEASLDPKGIQRCLQNLVSNAIDACIFDPSEDKKWVVNVRTMLEDEKVVGFEVSDNGCGMNEEVKAHLFTNFFTTKEGKGTGLGLLNTQKIVKQHGGTITVDSEFGKGSTFTIRVPYRKGNSSGADSELSRT